MAIWKMACSVLLFHCNFQIGTGIRSYEYSGIRFILNARYFEPKKEKKKKSETTATL